MLAKIKSSSAKRAKLKITTGVVHISSTFNNTIVTITDTKGNTIAWSSAGATGFKGARKGTPFAAQMAAEKAALTAMGFGLKKIEILVFAYIRLMPFHFLTVNLSSLG